MNEEEIIDVEIIEDDKLLQDDLSFEEQVLLIEEIYPSKS